MPPGELKHGTLALIIEGVPVFALVTQPDLYEKMISNIKEVKARDATVVALASRGDHETAKSVDYVSAYSADPSAPDADPGRGAAAVVCLLCGEGKRLRC